MRPIFFVDAALLRFWTGQQITVILKASQVEFLKQKQEIVTWEPIIDNGRQFLGCTWLFIDEIKGFDMLEQTAINTFDTDAYLDNKTRDNTKRVFTKFTGLHS